MHISKGPLYYTIFGWTVLAQVSVLLYFLHQMVWDDASSLFGGGKYSSYLKHLTNNQQAQAQAQQQQQLQQQIEAQRNLQKIITSLYGEGREDADVMSGGGNHHDASAGSIKGRSSNGSGNSSHDHDHMYRTPGRQAIRDKSVEDALGELKRTADLVEAVMAEAEESLAEILKNQTNGSGGPRNILQEVLQITNDGFDEFRFAEEDEEDDEEEEEGEEYELEIVD